MILAGEIKDANMSGFFNLISKRSYLNILNFLYSISFLYEKPTVTFLSYKHSPDIIIFVVILMENSRKKNCDVRHAVSDAKRR